MSDKENFDGFKQKMIDENEAKYGKEIREKYGEETVNYSNQKIKNMTKEQHAEIEKLLSQLNQAIRMAVEEGNPAGELAQTVCELHKKWIMNYWKQYSKEAHMSLVQMYVDDERFTEYYDKIVPGCAVFLRDAMMIFTGTKLSIIL